MLAEKCAYCGDMTDMPFECNYCHDPFCSEHRLPEDHRCVKLSQIRAKNLVKGKLLEMVVRVNVILSKECSEDLVKD